MQAIDSKPCFVYSTYSMPGVKSNCLTQRNLPCSEYSFHHVAHTVGEIAGSSTGAVPFANGSPPLFRLTAAVQQAPGGLE